MTGPAATAPRLRALGVVRACLRPLLGEVRAREACGYAYAVATLVAYMFHEQYRRAALGLVWVLLTPLLFLAVYLPVSFAVAGRTQQALGERAAGALHVALGFIAWIAFVEGVQSGATSLVNNPDVVRHSPIPLSILPAVRALAALLRATIGLTLLLALATALGGWPGRRLLLAPLALGCLGGLSLGLALLTSATAALFRDLLQVLPTLLLVWFFASPVVFLPDGLGDGLRELTRANPITPAVTLLRAAFLPAVPVSPEDVGQALAWAAVSVALGGGVFRWLSPRFGDHV